MHLNRYNVHLIYLWLILIACDRKNEIIVDKSKHAGLVELKSEFAYKVLHSKDYEDDAFQYNQLINEANDFLSDILGPKDDFYLLVVAEEDWKKNAYSPIPGMPEYYRGNLIVGAGKNSVAEGYSNMIRSLPDELTQEVMAVYTNEKGEFDLNLFFKKLCIHELTHNFQDPKNGTGFSISRWLEEIHANAGLYAFYKTKRPDELKHVMGLVDFSIKFPPPEMQYRSLEEFDNHYYEMQPSDYGFYQMKFTQLGAQLIDSLGNQVLKPLNEFIIKYDDSWKDKMTSEELKEKISEEVDPFLLHLIENW